MQLSRAVMKRGVVTLVSRNYPPLQCCCACRASFSKDMFDVVDDDRLFDVLGGICKRAKAAGGTVVTLSDAEREAWAKAMPNIAVEWAAKLDKAGAPGSAMLKAYMAKLKAAGQKPVRDWAAELPN